MERYFFFHIFVMEVMEDSFRVFIGDRPNLQGLKFSHIFIKQGEKT